MSAPYIVQIAGNVDVDKDQNAAQHQSVTVALPQPVTAGNSLILWVSAYQANGFGDGPLPTDSLGNLYLLLDPGGDYGSELYGAADSDLFLASVQQSGPCSVTFAYDNPRSWTQPDFIVMEVAGLSSDAVYSFATAGQPENKLGNNQTAQPGPGGGTRGALGARTVGPVTLGLYSYAVIVGTSFYGDSTAAILFRFSQPTGDLVFLVARGPSPMSNTGSMPLIASYPAGVQVGAYNQLPQNEAAWPDYTQAVWSSNVPTLQPPTYGVVGSNSSTTGGVAGGAGAPVPPLAGTLVAGMDGLYALPNADNTGRNGSGGAPAYDLSAGVFQQWTSVLQGNPTGMRYRLGGATVTARGNGILNVTAINSEGAVIPLSTDARIFTLTKEARTMDFGAVGQVSERFAISYDNGGAPDAWFEIHSSTLWLKPFFSGRVG